MKNLAMAVIIRDGLVLIQHRWRREGWVYEFPGGAVDAGESAEAAAVRELQEETGLTGCNLVDRVSAVNDYGGVVDFIVMRLATAEEPRMTDDARRQTFHWMPATSIPLSTFAKADVLFISDYLPRYTGDAQTTSGIALLEG
ncbi:NUDIX hydrolase [Pseudomonas sp. TE3610]